MGNIVLWSSMVYDEYDGVFRVLLSAFIFVHFRENNFTRNARKLVPIYPPKPFKLVPHHFPSVNAALEPPLSILAPKRRRSPRSFPKRREKRARGRGKNQRTPCGQKRQKRQKAATVSRRRSASGREEHQSRGMRSIISSIRSLQGHVRGLRSLDNNHHAMKFDSGRACKLKNVPAIRNRGNGSESSANNRSERRDGQKSFRVA